MHNLGLQLDVPWFNAILNFRVADYNSLHTKEASRRLKYELMLLIYYECSSIWKNKVDLHLQHLIGLI